MSRTSYSVSRASRARRSPAEPTLFRETEHALPVRPVPQHEDERRVPLFCRVIQRTAAAVLLQFTILQPPGTPREVVGQRLWFPRRLICLFKNREGHTECVVSLRLLREKLAGKTEVVLPVQRMLAREEERDQRLTG